MDLLELARLQSGTKAIDSATVNIPFVFIPGMVDLVEVSSGKPCHSRRWLLAKQLRKESVFGGAVGGAIDGRDFEGVVGSANPHHSRETKSRGGDVGDMKEAVIP